MECQTNVGKDNMQFVWEVSVFEGGVPNQKDINQERCGQKDSPLKFTDTVPDVKDFNDLQTSVADVCARKLGKARGRLIPQPLYADGNGDNNISRAWIYVASSDELYTVFARKTQNLGC